MSCTLELNLPSVLVSSPNYPWIHDPFNFMWGLASRVLVPSLVSDSMSWTRKEGQSSHSLKKPQCTARVAYWFSATFSLGPDPEDPDGVPHQAPFLEPASRSACVSATPSVCVCVFLINIKLKSFLTTRSHQITYAFLFPSFALSFCSLLLHSLFFHLSINFSFPSPSPPTTIIFYGVGMLGEWSAFYATLLY